MSKISLASARGIPNPEAQLWRPSHSWGLRTCLEEESHPRRNNRLRDHLQKGEGEKKQTINKIGQIRSHGQMHPRWETSPSPVIGIFFSSFPSPIHEFLVLTKFSGHECDAFYFFPLFFPVPKHVHLFQSQHRKQARSRQKLKKRGEGR